MGGQDLVGTSASSRRSSAGLDLGHASVQRVDVLTGLDNNNGKASILTAIDFSKSFSQCSHQQILLAYKKKLGLSNWGIAIQQVFFIK